MLVVFVAHQARVGLAGELLELGQFEVLRVVEVEIGRWRVEGQVRFFKAHAEEEGFVALSQLF